MPSRKWHKRLEKLFGVDDNLATEIIDTPAMWLGPRHRTMFHNATQGLVLSVVSTFVQRPKNGKDFIKKLGKNTVATALHIGLDKGITKVEKKIDTFIKNVRGKRR